MKLTFSPTSPFARKVRIAAIELGLIDRIELVTTSMVPGQFNETYSRDVNPLRKLPALILDDGTTLVDSEIIVEYLDELAGRKLFPAAGVARWRVKAEHAMTQGMLDAMLLCRYEKMLRPKEFYWSTWYDDQWERAWQGLAWFEARPEILTRPLDIVQIALVCVLGYADLRFADCGWRKAFPGLAAFNETMMTRESIKVSAPPAG
ncbi:MAG: glutathione S-transferase [Proteobacteria bacterium]|nr:MAG: glutathione S-transferase [Pseudomonadota bacterium]